MEQEKELSVVKTQADKALSRVSEITIATAEDYAMADEILVKIKTVGKMIKEKKEEITKPLNESLKRVRELFKPIETTHETAEEIIKKKMVSYRVAEDKRIEAEKAKIASKVESGYIKSETAIKKMEAVVDTKDSLKDAGVKTSTRKLPRVQINSFKDIPREYLIVNERAVLDALKAGIAVPGAELWYETIIA